jgi:threonine/homoserine/homoserine lactone efflux protein
MALAQALTTLVAGIVFGIALAAPPGPMNAVIAEESVARGWAAGFVTGLGAMTADACFFLLSLFGAVTFIQSAPLVRALMILAGGGLMLYFAYGAAGDAREFDEEGVAGLADGGAVEDVPPLQGFRKAFLLALTNPYQIAFWLTVGVGLLDPGTVDVLAKTPYVGASLSGLLVVETGSPALILGLFGGIVVWIVGFPAGLVAAGRRVERLGPAIAYGSALVLAGFGVFFLVDGLTALWPLAEDALQSLL